MRVVATAGHVDHGKSTLVRALTGVDPDRWEEEHRRGLTIDLGYVWTTLPEADGGEEIAFVDVPGHQRFIANMLAGIGPAPAVMFVVAADEGWRRQSQEHLAAVRALGITDALLVVTRSDLADPAPAIAQAREHLAGTPLEDCEAVAVSAVTGEGLDELRSALGRLVARLPEPDSGRVRLWIDRVFTVRGAGTVVTGTLEAGRLVVGQKVLLHTPDGTRQATIRGLQSLERPRDEVHAVARVALNLRGTSVDELHRGDLVLADPWHLTSSVDARLEGEVEELPEHLMAHLGTAAVPVRVRPLDGAAVRLTWHDPLPLAVGDRMVLRDPGRQQVLCGAQVLDVDPPALRRRGAGRRRGAELSAAEVGLDVAAEVQRRGWMRAADLVALGAGSAQVDEAQAASPGGVDGLLVATRQWEQWRNQLWDTVSAAVDADPLQARLSLAAAAAAVDLPSRELLAPLAADAGLEVVDGHLQVPGRTASLGTAEAGLARIEAALDRSPFQAPEREELDRAGIGPRQAAAAVRLGRVIDLGEMVLLKPLAPAMAMRELVKLPQPFTTSQARQALGTSRRVVIPLLEELDRRGWTRRVDAGHRQVVR